MKILYGLSGEGSGHSSRSKEVLTHLKKQGHEIKVISHDRGYRNLKKEFDVTEISGLRLSFSKNKISHTMTVLENFAKTQMVQKSIRKIFSIIGEFKPNICIVDFEPVTCTAANLKKIPIISIDNQHMITDTKIEYPNKYTSDALKTKAVINLFVVNAKAHIITTFFSAKVLKKKSILVPPILRREIFDIKPKDSGYMLVYLTYKFDKMIDILKSINKKFIVYGFNIDKIDSNITFKKASFEGFINDLATCECVLANAGFTLITESLYLHKPYLAYPVKHQFEQVLNAYYLDKMGYGKYWDEISKEKIESFLYNTDIYKKKLLSYKKNNNKKLFQTVDRLIEKYAKY